MQEINSLFFMLVIIIYIIVELDLKKEAATSFQKPYTCTISQFWILHL